MASQQQLSQKLDNVFNKMLLLTTNILVNIPNLPSNLQSSTDENAVITGIRNIVNTNVETTEVGEQIINLIMSYNQRLDSSSIFRSSEKSKTDCINYDLLSLNGVPQSSSDANNANIQQIALLFYKIVLEIHLHSLYCINVARKTASPGDAASGPRPDPIGGALFENPLFNAYDGAFHGADGIHDAEPRGDMTGSEIVPKIGNKPAKGGWEVVKNDIGKDSREKLIEAIRKSSIKPTDNQSDDITRSIKWASLNKTTGHHLLDPIESTNRLVCNIELQELIKLASSQYLNFGNRFKIVKVNSPKLKDEESANAVEKTTEIVRNVYGIGALKNNFAISDCSGPTPEELHGLVASSNSNPTLEDLENNEEDEDSDDEDESGGGGRHVGGAKRSKKKEGAKRQSYRNFISHVGF